MTDTSTPTADPATGDGQVNYHPVYPDVNGDPAGRSQWSGCGLEHSSVPSNLKGTGVAPRRTTGS